MEKSMKSHLNSYLTSGFLNPNRARYSMDMAAPPPMKKKRGISCV